MTRRLVLLLALGLIGLVLGITVGRPAAAQAPPAGAPLFRDVSATHLPPPLSVSQSSMDVEAVDLDGDGDLDLVVAGEFQTNVLLINDGTGRFTDGSAGLGTLPPVEVPGPLPPAHDSEDIAAEDFDGDGHVDLIFVSEDDVRYGRQNVHEYYRGRGDGTFERVYGVLPDTEANAVEAADLTGDGHLDLVISGAGQDRLLVGDGAGGFADETAARLPAESATGQDVEAVDVDGDGDLDLVVANEGGHRLWLNDGAGHFSDATEGRLPPPGNVEARKVTPVDLDGDGDLDLYFSHVGWQGRLPQDRLYLNDGTGHFTDVTLDRMPAESETTTDAKFADVDGDGDLDLVRVNLGPLQILLGDGTGHFVDATGAVLPAPLVGAGVGVEPFDADGDGRLDLYIARLAGPTYSVDGFDRLLLGVSGGTGSVGVPPPGGVRITAAPNPAVGPATLRLDLATPAPVTVRVLDVLGREQVRLLDRIPLAAGSHALALARARLPVGLYVVQVDAGGRTAHTRLVLGGPAAS